MVDPKVVVVRQEKSMVIAYVLLIFLGVFGVHRFYLGRGGSGVAQLLLSVIGWATVVFVVGLAPLAVVSVWLIVDLFLIPGMVNAENAKLYATV